MSTPPHKNSGLSTPQTALPTLWAGRGVGVLTPERAQRLPPPAAPPLAFDAHGAAACLGEEGGGSRVGKAVLVEVRVGHGVRLYVLCWGMNFRLVGFGGYLGWDV